MTSWTHPLTFAERRTLAEGFAAGWADKGPPLLDMIHQWEHEALQADSLVAGCGSPIERALILAILREDIFASLTMSVQEPIGPFKADIAFTSICKPYPILLAIECDGAAYHAADATQVSRDKKRDRYFTAQSVPFMRFTGSEIWKDGSGCAREILAVLKLKEAAETERVVAERGAQ